LASERDGKLGVHSGGSMGVGVCRLEVIEGPSGRRRRSRAGRARIAAEGLMPGVRVADVARRHGATRWQVCDWRRKRRAGGPAAPESVAVLPVFAERVAEGTAADASAARPMPDLEIVAGGVVVRAGAGADEGPLVGAIRAARAAAP